MTVINNYQTWLALLQLVNVQQNGQVPPSVFNTWYNEVSDWLFKKLAEEYQLNQVMSDLLSPYLVPVNVLITAMPGENWGRAPYPTDYQYFQSAAILRQRDEEKCFLKQDLPIIDGDGKSKRFEDEDIAAMKVKFAGENVEERPVQLIDTQRWSNCLNHARKKPTWKDPKITQYNAGFKVSPKGLTSLVLYYLKTPKKSVFNYTISAQDILIYDSLTSVQLEWSDQVLPMFLPELQKKYAAYIGDEKLYQMGDNDKKSV
jgi:hypothetical protein